MISKRFNLPSSSEFVVQYFDEEWQSYIDVEDVDCLVDKTKLRVTSVTSVSFKSVASSEAVESRDVLSEQLSTSSTVPADEQWPSQFAFPVQKVPPNLMTALDKGIDLCSPKQRYLRGQLLQILCSEAVKLTTHPDHSQKIEMAKSIITAWPHLKEPIGRGYDGWLASIVDCLKSTRRVLGLVDKSRSVAIMERKRALSSGPGVSTEKQNLGQQDSEANSVHSCTAGIPSSKVTRKIPRYLKKSMQVQQSSQKQQSVENTDVENCADHTEDTGVFGSQITTVAVIEFSASTSTVEQVSDSTTTPLSPTESVSVMKELWSKPEGERPWDQLLHLLKITFDSRRMMVSSSSTTTQIRDEYPALFFREAFIQEYCLLTEMSECMTKAMDSITEKCQVFVKLSQKKVNSGARIEGLDKLAHIMSQLSLALEIERDPDIERELRAIAGLLLLPLLLKDNSSYFITPLEVCSLWPPYVIGQAIYIFILSFVFLLSFFLFFLA